MKTRFQELKTKEELLTRYFEIATTIILIDGGEELKDLDYQIKVSVINDLNYKLSCISDAINNF